MGLFSANVDTQLTSRDELRRQQRERFAMAAGLEELRRADLRFDRFSIAHEPTGDHYRVYRGEIDAGPTHPACAFSYAPNGAVVFLELVRKAPQ